jgi:phenylalanyl-tRNA synthetase beta chain
MKVSYNWLKEYVTCDFSPEELAAELTMVGIEVEEIISMLPEFHGIIVAKVKAVEKHPNADKLTICQVYTGKETVQVICGAPNVSQGQTVPFAPPDTSLPNGMRIKKAKIRGTESFGMICSEEELGLAKESEGIWELPQEWQVGQDVHSILLNQQDYVLDLSITPNRPDAMSMIGIAREVAAITSGKYKFPEIKFKESQQQAKDVVSVEIQSPNGCPRYAARVIKDLKIGPSPAWMAQRLEAGGIRPINNIVDITNYVLLELGQPLHAFDLAQISGNKIIVRDSVPNEIFTTLDEKDRVLPANTVMICDAQKPVAIGGIMGGLNSEVSYTTVDVLLESAYFTPTRIASSSKKLGLSSEASQRFERGIDPEGVIRACDRASGLLAEYAGGTVLSGVVDSYPIKYKARKVKIRPDRVNIVLGTDLSENEISNILHRLEIKYDKSHAIVPSFRPDLEREVDLIEEVARIVHFENIPTREQTELDYNILPNENELLLTFIKSQILELGFSEVITNSMISKRDLDAVKSNNPIMVINSISDDMNAMRPSLIPGLLKIAAHNINRNIPDLRIFELGRVFLNTDDYSPESQPYYISGLIHGIRAKTGWEKSLLPIDFYDIKGIVQAFLNKIFLDKYEFILYDRNIYFDSNQVVGIKVKNTLVGHFGLIKQGVGKQFEIESPVFGFEFSLMDLQSRIELNRHYQDYSRFPYVEKDVAFIVDISTGAGEIENVIWETGKPLINYVEVFDLYQSDILGDNKKSIAFRMRFQSHDRTLKDKEVNSLFDRIIKVVQQKIEASLRE